VKLLIQQAAEHDILSQIEWYASQGAPGTASRFSSAVMQAIEALVRMPNAGAPKATANPQLAGLRTWPVKGFEEQRIYYLVTDALLTILRILHGKRNTQAILAEAFAEAPVMLEPEKPFS
jgi:toxin ParE1/3/4